MSSYYLFEKAEAVQNEGGAHDRNPPRPAVVVLHSGDNVGTVLRDLPKGVRLFVPGEAEFPVDVEIRFGHKVAITPIERGELVRKYGLPIGKASTAIDIGCHVHTHNVETLQTEQE